MLSETGRTKRNRQSATIQRADSDNGENEVYECSADAEERDLYEEMRRAASTVLLAMRSERDILAALQAQA